jgi:hypothetical protein
VIAQTTASRQDWPFGSPRHDRSPAGRCGAFGGPTSLTGPNGLTTQWHLQHRVLGEIAHNAVELMGVEGVGERS